MYEELIQRLENAAGGPEGIKMAHEAADAIAALQTENADVRDKLSCAESDLSISQDCSTCGNRTPWCEDNPDRCKGYKWRGAQGEG